MIILCTEESGDSFFDHVLVILSNFKAFITDKLSFKSSEVNEKAYNMDKNFEIIKKLGDDLNVLVKTIDIKDNEGEKQREIKKITDDLLGQVNLILQPVVNYVKLVAESNDRIDREIKELNAIRNKMEDMIKNLSDLYNNNYKQSKSND